MRSLHGVAWLGVVGGIVWVMLAPIIMPVGYGPAFAPASAALQWLAGVAVVAGLSGHYRYGLIAAGQQNVEMIISVIGSAVAVILIPVGYLSVGVSGAAIGVWVAELVVWLSAWWMASRRLGLNGHRQLLHRPLLTTASTFILLWLLPLSSLGVRIIIVVTSIAVLAFTLDATIRSDLRALLAAGRPWIKGQFVKRVQVIR
jgi:O-antigen/teichoic acid export membrane protein